MEATNFSNLRPIRPEDIIDVRTLRRYAREGRLYLYIMPHGAMPEADVVERALEYVGQIDQYAHPHVKPYISILWRQILTDPELNDKLTMQRGQSEGELNRYRMMYLVTYLLEAGIYVGVSALRLHHVLEHTTKKDAIYRNQMNYAMIPRQTRHLRTLIAEFRTKYMD